jgi:hypothetical protein
MPGGSITCNGSTVNFITLKGEVQALAPVVDDVTRPGVNGHAYWEAGSRGRPFEMVGYLDCATTSSARVFYLAMAAWRGKLASFMDDYGLTGQNAMMLEVEKLRIVPLRSPVGGTLGGGATVLLIMRFLMQMTR